MARIDKQHLLVKVAEMYYIDQKSQSEIASQLGYSRSTISRLLTEAREQKVVEIHINYPLQVNTTLRNRLCDRFGLKDAAILAYADADLNRNLQLVGKLGAEYLLSHMPNNNILGISWGNSINELINQLKPAPAPDLKVVQVIGSIGRGDVRIDSNAFAYQLASLFRATCYTLNAPFIVENEQNKRMLMRDRSIFETLQLARQADVILTGIGTITPEHSSLMRAGYVTLQELQAIGQVGGVGNIFGTFFDIHGRILDIDINRRIVGLSLEELLTLSSTTVALVTGASKVRPILGALRGGYIDVLITDSQTAESVIRLDEESRNYVK